jgi:hypothetical protein
MLIKTGNTAVSEIVGTVLLLAIAISIFSVVYMNVLSEDGPNPETFATIVGKIEAEDLVFEHRSGETLDLDSQVILTVGGERQPPRALSELLDTSSQQDSVWNIGERIVWPLQNLGIAPEEQVRIDGEVYDKESNSMVFWGMLQDGYTVPPFGRGGLWHFNESYWDGTPGEVKDSSGNENHGTARNGANTTNDVVSPLANRSGIFNVIDDNDYVEVDDFYSLDITDHITMEAWVKPFLDVQGTTELLDQFGYTPYIIGVNGNKNIYAIVSEDQSQEGVIQTVNVTPHKPMTEDSIVDIDYALAEGRTPKNIRPIIAHISNDLYIVAYNNMSESKNLSVYFKTFKISSNGSIEYTGNKIFDDRESNIGEPNRPSIVKVSDSGSHSIFAVAYGINVDSNHSSVGIIRTVNISYDGTMQFTGHTANFDDAEGYGPSIIHVSDDVFAIAYRNASNLGVVKTFNISSDGYIAYTGENFIFDSQTNNKPVNKPSFIKISDMGSYGVFGIVYGAYTDNSIPAEGIIKTINIYHSNGDITWTGFDKTFEASSCYSPHVIHHFENYYVIVFDTEPWANSKGKYIPVEIGENGNIICIGLPVTFDEDRCHDPVALKMSERGFAVVYESIAGGSGHPGYLKTFQLEYPSDVYSIGIYKYGSYGIYANPKKVFVNINTKTINASIVANAWNHVVLTYDLNQMKLYVNGILKSSAPLTEKINITSSNLIIGDIFYGLIDEVAIYDKVLTGQEVYERFREFSPIIISNVNTSDISYNSAKITWETNTLSDSIIRYGTTTPPTTTELDSTMVKSHSITLTGLLASTTYYYEVQSSDQDGVTIIDNNGGRYYTFTTENRPPNEPRLPNPSNGRKNVKITADLSWVGGDEDGDPVTYDVYLRTTNPPLTKVSANQSAQTYSPDPDLNNNTKYYWKIIAWDNFGASTEGPIWFFTTRKN